MSHYDTLGVERGADADAIKTAYRRLASKHHPDRGGDTQRFQEIQSAYETLSDPQKRQAYDMGGQNPFGGGHHPFQQGGFQFDINGTQFNFNDLFGGGFHQAHQQQQRAPTRMQLWITLADAYNGGKRPVSVGAPGGGATLIEINIPEGVEDSSTVHYGKIAPGGGDLLITFRIHPNPVWQRDGSNLITEHPVSVWDLILGGETTIRDAVGRQLALTIPPNTQPGTIMRLRGQGMKVLGHPHIAGDILVKIQAKLPETITDELRELITKARGEEK